MNWFKFIVLIIFAGTLSSCSSVISNSKITALQENYCAPSIRYSDDVIPMQNSLRDTLVVGRLSLHDYTLASHIGLLPLLSQFSHSTTSLEKLEVKQKITDKILLFQTEIDATASELDCNGERFDQLARLVDSRNSKKNTQLTVASIALGAAITLSTALINNDDINKGINISGGIAGAGLGFLLLNPKGKKVELKIHRSLLKNVWTESNSDTAFPPSLWRVMNDKSFSNDGNLSLIQTLKKRWILFAFEDDIDANDERLYFGKGGYFSSDDIHLMSNMNNELQSSVRTVQQDLRSLISSISRW